MSNSKSPDLIYNRKRQKLSGFGKEWSASSGIEGRYDPLSKGEYSVPINSLMVGTEEVAGIAFNKKYSKNSYVDKKGFGWFLWLGKGNLGIHPDGNVPGTKGCIGIVNGDTRDLFNELRKRNKRILTVKVITGLNI